jgi:lysozyme
MKIDQTAKDFIVGFEGVRLKAYQDSVGVWTIGVGSTYPTVQPGQVITQQEAMDRFDRDISKFETGVTNLVKVQLEQCQFDALVSFAFNVGLGNLAKSTLLKKVNAGQFNQVPSEFLKWDKAGGRSLPGLTRRRHAEAAMFAKAHGTEAPNEEESSAEPDLPTPSKSMAQSKEGNTAAISGALASAGAASQVVDQVQQANDTMSALLELLHKPSFWVLVIIVGAAAAIWYWRSKRLQEEGA